MPNAPGSTQRLLHGLCRTGLLTVLLSAPACLWWPSVPGWAALSAALLGIWCLWLGWRIVAGRRRAPTHPMHVALAIVYLAAMAHVMLVGRVRGPDADWAIAGEFGTSLMVHAALLALLVMLCQDLVPRSARGAAGQTLLGLATFAGACQGLALGPASQGRLMLAMMGWAGVAIFACPLMDDGRAGQVPGPAPKGRRTRGVRVLRLATTATMGVALALWHPPSLALVAGALALTLLLAGAMLPERRWPWLLGGLLAAGSAAMQWTAMGDWLTCAWTPDAVSWLGLGEQALRHYDGRTSGLALLSAMIGVPGVLLMVGGLLAGLAWAMWPLRRHPRALHGRGLLTALAGAMALAAWLVAPGGLFNPGVNVVLAATWAVLPKALGRAIRTRSGWWLLAGAASMSLTVGLVRHRGLLMWMLFSFERGQLAAHAIVGGLVTLLLLWLMDAWRGRPWPALALGMAGGPGGELAQNLLSMHRPEWSDIGAHLVGVLGAFAVYVLCRGARWAEPRS